MKKFLFLVAMLCTSPVWGQPELRLVSSGGEAHARSFARTSTGTLSWDNPIGDLGDMDPVDQVLWDMTDSHNSQGVSTISSDSHDRGSSNSTVDLDFTRTTIDRFFGNFSTNPFISFTSEQYQYCWVNSIDPITNFLNYAVGFAYSGGRYGFVVTPNNTSTWQTQNVACRFQLSGYGVATEPYTTVSNYRDRSQYIKVKWGNSYIYATFDGDEEVWTYTMYYKNSQNQWVIDTDTTEGIFLDIDVTSYQEMTSSSFLEAEIQVSTTPTTVGNSLSTSCTNYIKQSVNNYQGTGSGAGSLSAYSTAGVTLTLQAKLKN